MRRAAGFTAAAIVLAAVAHAQRPSDVARRGACEALHGHEGRWTDVPALQDELVELGPDAIPTLFEILVQGEVPSLRAAREKRLTPASEFAVVTALGLAPPRALRTLLDEVANRPLDQAARVQGLRLLARFGTTTDLDRATKLARHDDGSPPELRAAFGTTVEQVLGREPRGLAAPALEFTNLAPVLHRETAAAIGRLGTRTAFEHLARALDRRGTADALLLLELRRLARTLPVAPDAFDVARIRAVLASDDPVVVNLAAGLLGDLRDAAAIPELIAKLTTTDPNARRAAHTALAALTHVDLGVDADRWRAWYTAQLRWLESDGDAVAEAIADGPVQSALAAIASSSSRHSLGDAVVDLLLPGLARSQSILVERTATALGHLGSWRAVPALIDALESGPAAALPAVSGALERITSLDVPADAAAWRSRLQSLEEAQ